MNEKHKFLKQGLAVVLMTSALNMYSQSSLIDYKNGTVDLGLGIEQSQLLTTAAVQVISGEELQKTAAISLKEALYGKLLGLTVLKPGGDPTTYGSGVTFNIRGVQSTSESGVLILVDGIERSIEYLSVSEVESVSVLRDAAAVALLGYQGTNGAILIKTKRGISTGHEVSVSYDHKFTFNPRVADFVDGYTYAKALNAARMNDGLSPAYNDYELNAFATGREPYYYPNVDWKDEAFKDLGAEDQLNLTLRGGNDKLQYFAMLDYTDTRGILEGTDQGDYTSQLRSSKANIRTNIDVKLSSTTKMRLNALGTFMETKRPHGADANGITDLIYRTPASAFPVMNDPEGELAGIWGGNTTYTTGNVAAQIQGSGFLKTHARSFQGDVSLDQDLDFWLEGLSVSARVGYNNFSEIYEDNVLGFMYGYQRHTFDANGRPNGLTTYSAGDLTDNLEFSYWTNQHSRSSYLSLSADYQTSFREDDNFLASLIWHQKNTTYSGQYNVYNRMNVMAYLHYDLKQKYIADLVLAMNASNRSYPEKWAFSPTLSLGYIFANNDNASLLNFGKLRFSAGIQHTDYVPIQGIWLESYVGTGDYIMGPGNGATEWGSFYGYIPTPHFNLETAYKFNLGTDLRLFKSLDFNVDLYYQLRDDILLSEDGLNSSVLGRPSSYINWGRVASYGVEVGMNWVKQVNKDLALNLGGNFTWGRNEQLRNIENIAYDYLTAIGGRVNQAWGLEVEGIFESEAEIESSPRQNFENCKPGDFKYKDQNGDNVIDENDVVKMGYDTSIPELNFSFNLGLKYKNFGVNATFQGAAHYTAYLGTTGVWVPMVDGANLSEEYYNNCWGVSDNPIYPRLTTRTNNNNYRANDVWYKNLNFFKLRNCEVYYYLPEKWISKVNMSTCKLFVKGENLMTLSNLDVMDPENIGTYFPTLMGVNVGVSVKF